MIKLTTYFKTYFLACVNALMYKYANKLYIISSDLDVKYSGLDISSTNKKYNNTIIDGEYIFIPKYNKFLFASFDLLYYGNEDIRSEVQISKRLLKLDDVISKCFNYTFKMKIVARSANNYRDKTETEDEIALVRANIRKAIKDLLNKYYTSFSKLHAYLSKHKKSKRKCQI